MKKYQLNNKMREEEINNSYINASSSGDLETIKYILSNRKTNTSDLLPTIYKSLIGAASKGHLHVIQYFLEESPIKNKIDVNYNNDALMVWACSLRKYDIVKYLLEKEYVDINTNEGYPLRNACSKGEYELVEYLLSSDRLKNHADIQAKENDALHQAFYSGDMKTIETILSCLTYDNPVKSKTMFESVVGSLLEKLVYHQNKIQSEDVINIIERLNKEANSTLLFFVTDKSSFIQQAFFSGQEKIIDYFLSHNGFSEFLLEKKVRNNIVHTVCSFTKTDYLQNLLQDKYLSLFGDKDTVLHQVLKTCCKISVQETKMEYIRFLAEDYQLELTNKMQKYLKNSKYAELSKYFLYTKLSNDPHLQKENTKSYRMKL